MRVLLFICAFCFAIDPGYTNYIKKCSKFYDIPYEIITAIIIVESSGNENAVSYKGAVGLMQITTNAYEDYKKLNPIWSDKWIKDFNIVKTNWKANINVGCWYLKRICYKEKGNWKGAITAYFWGPNHKKTTDTYFNKVSTTLVFQSDF